MTSIVVSSLKAGDDHDDILESAASDALVDVALARSESMVSVTLLLPDVIRELSEKNTS
ncbi:hypothetical protein QA639_34275 [Bradyrhizobium pachyrhizi]|uniref:hypothetical protein n=1 Tax=Bradyrhizobium pachyrhizi TaxID=280333 RepID=UPI0024B19589|nr:hypothetical protein [Bradyrhizobium pachyrhizi]WFU54619.1 hypothetical protein QA639_34275 [Bradyrhizobium pachyrhizi]